MRVDGDTAPSLRSQLFSLFQTDHNCHVMVAALRACGLGVTLTAASRVVLLDLHWNPALEQQVGEIRLCDKDESTLGSVITQLFDYLFICLFSSVWLWS